MALEGRGVSGDFGPLEGEIRLAEACLSPPGIPGNKGRREYVGVDTEREGRDKCRPVRPLVKGAERLNSGPGTGVIAPLAQ